MRKLYIIVLLGAAFWGCEDFLDREPKDFVSPKSFSSVQDVELAVSGAYRALINEDQNTRPIYTDFMVDNGFMDKPWSGEVEFWDMRQTVNSEYAERRWTEDYTGILRANSVLENIEQVQMDPNLKRRFKGEMYFLRAYFYSDLIEFFGDVPLRTSVDGISEQHSPRVSSDIILEMVLKDLDSAANMLDVTYTGKDHGRATRGAALAWKGRVLMFYERYEEAAEAFEQVMNLEVYDLDDEYDRIFNDPSYQETSEEIIFDIQLLYNYKNQKLSSPWYTFFFQWGSYMALSSLEEQYYMNNGLPIGDPASGYDDQDPWSGRDPRLGYTMVLPYTSDGFAVNGDPMTYIPSVKKDINFSSMRIRKWVDYSDNHNVANSGVNNIIIRYADVLLMRAEALVESGDYTNPEVVDLINRVRQRPSVNMPPVEDVEGTNLSQDELRQIIRHERRVEFAFEGVRLFDIRRWKIGEEAYGDAVGYDPAQLTTQTTTYEKYTFRQRSFDAQKGYLWPIPIKEIVANDEIDYSDNNPGYE